MSPLTAAETSTLATYQFSQENRLAVWKKGDGTKELVKVKTATLRFWDNYDASLKGVSNYLCTKTLPAPETAAYKTIHELAARYLLKQGHYRIPQLWQNLGSICTVAYESVQRNISDQGIECAPFGMKGTVDVIVTPLTQYKHIFAQMGIVLPPSLSYAPHVHNKNDENLVNGTVVVHLVVDRYSPIICNFEKY